MSKENIIFQIQECFKGLIFTQEKHTYTFRGNSFESVSSLISNFTEPFKTELISSKIAEKTGVCQDEIKKEWKDIATKACHFGTRVHDFAERYAADRFKIKIETYYDSVYQHLKEGEELSPQSKAVIKFWDDMPDYYVPILLELRMFSEEWGYAGTTDIVLLDMRDMSLVIGDYKTNKDLFKNFKGKRLTGIFSYLKDNPFNKYQLQLSYYEILLRQAGIRVSRRFVVWLKDDGSYQIYDTIDLTEQLIGSLHKNKIDASW